MTIKVGSRKSKLALKQVEIVMRHLEIDDYEVVKFSTEGDKKSEMGYTQFDKLNFVEDIENKLLSKDIDIAVHSAKDMPAELNLNLDNYFISDHKDGGYEDLEIMNKDILIFRSDIEPVFKKDMRLGTSSLRRQMQAKFELGAKNISNLNGNIDTRIDKLEGGEFDCIILAYAGCSRLDFIESRDDYCDFGKINAIPLYDHLTPTGQGMLCMQKNKDFMLPDSEWLEATLNTAVTSASDINLSNISLTNRFLKEIGADCHSSLAVSAIGELSENFNYSEINCIIYGKSRSYFLHAKGNKGEDGHKGEDQVLQDVLKEFYNVGGEDLLNEHN
tara:strand:+ start:758 stop:1750 length:993 start_codon:yes stop_codon:yes gene_type:complete